MIHIKPIPLDHFYCPECNDPNPAIKDILFPGMFVLADCKCSRCDYSFLHVLPIGHHTNRNQCIGEVDRVIHGGHHHDLWLTDALRYCCDHHTDKKVKVEKMVYQSCENVLILNTLDYIYGHALLKLYNADYHLKSHKELGLILIVPKIFEWLIPDGCAEAWVVDLPLNEFRNWHYDLNKFIKKEMERFSSIHLSYAYSHPRFDPVNIETFTRVKPFDLAQFSTLPPTVTIVLREDRWWFKNRLGYYIYRIARRVNLLPQAKKILSRLQNILVKKLIKKLKKEFPEISIYVVGVGNTGNFSRYGKDLRSTTLNAEIETSWCKAYARSHFVFGVHGSNMLLPSAHSAGCIEILPEDRLGNIIQDISVRYEDRRQLYFYQLLDQYTGTGQVARRIIAGLQNYDSFCRHMVSNTYESDAKKMITKMLKY